MSTDRLSARHLVKYGLRRGAYDGARKRRFVLFEDTGGCIEQRSEFDTKHERDEFALRRLDVKESRP